MQNHSLAKNLTRATICIAALSTQAACLAQIDVRTPRPYVPTKTGATTILPFGVDYDRILREHPQDYVSWYRRGQTKQQNGDLTGALRDYSQSNKVNPLQSDDPPLDTPTDQITVRSWSYEYSGMILRRLKRYKESAEALTHAIALRPNFNGNYQERALTYKLMGCIDLAKKDLEKADALQKAKAKDPYGRAPIRLAPAEAPHNQEKSLPVSQPED